VKGPVQNCVAVRFPIMT